MDDDSRRAELEAFQSERRASWRELNVWRVGAFTGWAVASILAVLALWKAGELDGLGDEPLLIAIFVGLFALWMVFVMVFAAIALLCLLPVWLMNRLDRRELQGLESVERGMSGLYDPPFDKPRPRRTTAHDG